MVLFQLLHQDRAPQSPEKSVKVGDVYLEKSALGPQRTVTGD